MLNLILKYLLSTQHCSDKPRLHGEEFSRTKIKEDEAHSSSRPTHWVSMGRHLRWEAVLSNLVGTPAVLVRVIPEVLAKGHRKGVHLSPEWANQVKGRLMEVSQTRNSNSHHKDNGDLRVNSKIRMECSREGTHPVHSNNRDNIVAQCKASTEATHHKHNKVKATHRDKADLANILHNSNVSSRHSSSSNNNNNNDHNNLINSNKEEDQIPGHILV